METFWSKNKNDDEKDSGGPDGSRGSSSVKIEPDVNEINGDSGREPRIVPVPASTPHSPIEPAGE